MKPGIVEVMESVRGRELTDAEASRLLHMQGLLGIDNNDALWVVMLALEHYQQLYDESLSQLPGVQRLTSTLVMKTVVAPHTPVSTADVHTSPRR